MGRNKKHKKEIRAEKSKTQLKTKLTKTKFLPKGGNVTDVNFKVKPIVIREQLKTYSGDELVTKTNHNLKDVLTRLNHTNTGMRFQACENLTEWLTSSPNETLEQSLFIIFPSVCKLVLDIETKVRQKAIKVIGVALQKVSTLKLAPFFDVLASYVLCAMTHINMGVQEDSLLVIDIYLDFVPDLIIKYYDKLFSHFLILISKLRSDSKLSRTITVNLRSKLTSNKWRINVLTRLLRMLNIVMETQCKVPSNSLSTNCKVVVHGSGNFIPLYRKVGAIIPVKPDNLENNNQTEYVRVLLPLLYETWAEAVPLDEISYLENDAMVIDQDGASILSCVAGVLKVLMEFVRNLNDKNVMHSLFIAKESKLIPHLIKQFPYRQQDQYRKVKKQINKLLTVNTDFKCVHNNLVICYVFSVLFNSFPSPLYLKKASKLVEFINVCLSHRNYVPSQAVKTITSVLRIIFFENYKSWTQKGLISEMLLDNIVNFHNHLPIDSEHRMEVFNLLIDIAKEPDITSSNKFLSWLDELPQLLLKSEVSIDFVNTLSLLASQNNKTFLNAFINALPQFLTNITHLKVLNDNDFPKAHIKLINILYYVPHLNWNHIEMLESFVEFYQNWEYVEHVKLVLSKRCCK